jgi:hypothetical protein
MARLCTAGHIDADQLAAAISIRMVHDRIGRDVAIGTMSMETRVDQSRSGDGTFFEKLGAVRAEVAYTRWRQALDRPAPVLALIVEDHACREVARRHHMRDASLRRMLTMALDLWFEILGRVRKEVTSAELALAQAGVL